MRPGDALGRLRRQAIESIDSAPEAGGIEGLTDWRINGIEAEVAQAPQREQATRGDDRSFGLCSPPSEKRPEFDKPLGLLKSAQSIPARKAVGFPHSRAGNPRTPQSTAGVSGRKMAREEGTDG